MESKNALAELAEDLDSFWTLERQQRDSVVDKAQRIIAELAKVEKPIQLARGHGKTFTHLYEFLEADKNRAVEIVRDCRAIAEEGSGDGKQ